MEARPLVAKKYLAYTLWLLLVLALLELSFWGYFSFAYVAPAGHPADAELEALIKDIPQTDLDKFIAGQYDPYLGWSNGPDVSYEHEGSHYQTSKDRIRINPHESEIVRISAYGDSFTFGDEVENDETFPYFLSRLTNSNVINYGVSAYGTDQALRRLEQNLRTGRKTDVVVLEFIQDSIKRNMNMYLVFKYGFEKWTRYMFKPMLHESPGGYEWVDNPLQELAGTDDVLEAYRVSKHYDWFYQDPEPSVSFPYTVSAVKTIWFLWQRKSAGAPDWGHAPSERKMTELIGRYAALAEEFDFVPVLIYIPLGFEIREYLSGNTGQRFSSFLSETARDYQGTSMIVIDLARELQEMENRPPMEDFYVRPYDGHPSALGNRVIAEVIYKNISPNLAN